VEDDGVERTGPICFLARCHKRQLNQALSILCFTPGFLQVCSVQFTRAIMIALHYTVLSVFNLLVVLVRLSVPVQVTE